MENKSTEPPSPEPVDIDMTQLTTPGLFLKSPSDYESDKPVKHQGDEITAGKYPSHPTSDEKEISVDSIEASLPSLRIQNKRDESLSSNVTKEKNNTVATLEPYVLSDKSRQMKSENVSTNTTETRQRNKRKTYTPNPALIHFDHLFGSSNWSRFLVLKTKSMITGAKLENLLLSKYATSEMSLRQISNYEWIVEATTRAQSEAYQSLNNLSGIEITFTRHEQLNSIQGTVILPPNLDNDGLPDRNLLLDSLQKRYSNVEDVEVYQIPNRKSPNKKLRIAKIKFEGQVLPRDIRIEGQRREIIPYVPKPLQCSKCCKYGHTNKYCHNNEVCAYCGTTEHPTTWNCGPPNCVNCSQNHHAKSKDCPFYLYNTELKLLISRTGMSIREAKEELKARGFIDPAKRPWYKTSAKEKIHPNNSEAKAENSVTKINPPLKEKKVKEDVKKAEVVTTNQYEVLNDLVENDESQTQSAEMDADLGTNKGLKRMREIPSPPQKKKINKEERKRPNIHRVNLSLTTDELDNITPSPVFPSRMKRIMESKENIHTGNCKCKECLQRETQENTIETHDNLCGCHDCFVNECHIIKPMDKEKLVNTIRSFITNRKVKNTTKLELHPTDCMCVDHLLYYKKNKILIIDKFMDKQITKDGSELVPTAPCNSENK